jgi:tetratricopeptide (TPR) repeat protein
MIYLLFSFLLLFSAEAREKICLNMLVKDQADVIRPTLETAKQWIDYWVIIDLGSTDGTQKIILEQLKEIPGELIEKPWKAGGEARTEGLHLAKRKGGYLLFLDAGDLLEWEKGFDFPELTKDVYYVWHGTRNALSLKPLLVKASHPAKWKGIVHEYLDCGASYTVDTLSQITCLVDGGRIQVEDTKSAWKRVKVLETALKIDPSNFRYAFHLAENYREAGEKGKALECYQKRGQMEDCEEQVFWSLLQAGHLLKELFFSKKIVLEAYREAHLHSPHRPEPIYYIAELYNNHGMYQEAYQFLKESLPKIKVENAFFNQKWIGRYGLMFQLSICSYYVGKYEESLSICDRILAMDMIPNALREQVSQNRTYPLNKLMERVSKKN